MMAQAQTESSKNVDDKNPESTSSKPAAQKEEAWGYDLYPERRGTFQAKLSNILIGKEGKEGLEKIKCENHVYDCVKTSPIVKVMMAALRSSGCPIDIRRHISCEVCDYSVSGGYDPELNQIVVCQNVSTRKGMVQGVLAHEMIHMFDYCRNELDFKNMEHLACTEIRAANLTHCSFTSAWSQGDASFTKIKQAHQDCVKTKALYSVLAVRQIGMKEAVDVIEKVFPKCYDDLEPIGRRIRRNSEDMTRAYKEASYYGKSAGDIPAQCTIYRRNWWYEGYRAAPDEGCLCSSMFSSGRLSAEIKKEREGEEINDLFSRAIFNYKNNLQQTFYTFWDNTAPNFLPIPIAVH